MRIAIAADGPNTDSRVEPVLGRADWFVILDARGARVEALRNPHRDQREGCGAAVASLLLAKGVSAVLAGNCGPKAALACRKQGLSVSFPYEGAVGDAAARFLRHLEDNSASAS
ncbi:NifB/NifX family molybdenum-iron cluster-binding protein [Desulfocurvus sp. DL9XJH121]